jgi:cyclase
MASIRIVPCLDIAGNRVVKGENFSNLREMGDPVALSNRHAEAGADEITLLDIEATIQNREAILPLVRQCAERLMVPLTVGGGVDSVSAVAALLQAGADKVSVGSAGVVDTGLLTRIGVEFGNQVLVASLDIQRGATASGYELTIHGGRTATGLDALERIEQLEDLGVGELLLNSIEADGLRQGFDIQLIERARQLTPLPIIASGGAGAVSHFVTAALAGADALLAASVFHEGSIQIAEVKVALGNAGFEVRLGDRVAN